MSLYDYDRALQTERLCGVDEAGRGPLAGPVYAAAVVLPLDHEIVGLNDSKKLTPKKRDVLYREICEFAVDYGIGFATVEEIDRLNILQATFLAMRRAVEQLRQPPSLVLVDGNRNPLLPVPCQLLVKGDATSASVAAASILAKVSRDRELERLAEQYPEYQFEQHKGYGTKLHYERLLEYGITPVHRRSFLKKLQRQEPNLSLYRGKYGEKLGYQYLKKKGYQILARNYSTPDGEIDLIATDGKVLAFVEVKLRDQTCPSTPGEAVTRSKQRKISKTAACFLAKHPTNLQPRFDVLEISLVSEQEVRFHLIAGAFMPEENYGLL